jgi:hypothetical protein
VRCAGVALLRAAFGPPAQLLDVPAPAPHCLLQANELRYYRIDVRQPLRRQLEGKVVVEFPTLLVLLPREVEGYEFVEGEPQQQPGEEAPPAPADAPPPADAGAAR